MGLLDALTGGDDDDGVADRGIQPSARLQEMRPRDGKAGLWTSDLSVDELLLTRRAGFEPLGLVLGTSIYHIGMQNSQWSKNQELTTITHAMYHARELAMSRMEAEADVLGADGIVGVRLEVGRYAWGAHLAEFMAIGTAVRAADGSSHRTIDGKPFTSLLSGQDFYKLRVAGFRPSGLVMGSCVYHVAHQGMRAAFKQIGQNVEMPTFTTALYEARELAMARMQHEATRLGAVGVVGTQIHESSHGWESHVIEFLSLGTAVVADATMASDAAITLTLGVDR